MVFKLQRCNQTACTFFENALAQLDGSIPRLVLSLPVYSPCALPQLRPLRLVWDACSSQTLRRLCRATKTFKVDAYPSDHPLKDAFAEEHRLFLRWNELEAHESRGYCFFSSTCDKGVFFGSHVLTQVMQVHPNIAFSPASGKPRYTSSSVPAGTSAVPTASVPAAVSMDDGFFERRHRTRENSDRPLEC